MMAYLSARYLINNDFTKKVSWVVLSILPCFIYYWFTGDEMGIEFALASFSLYHVLRTFRWGMSAIVLHWIVIMLGIILLLCVQPSFWIYACVVTVWALLCMGLSVFGKPYRTLGSFTLIPTLYLSIALSEHAAFNISQHGMELVIWALVALVGPTIVHFIVCSFDDRHQVVWKCHTLVMPKWNPQAVWTVVSITIAVFLTTIFVRYYHVPESNWVIWSSVAVITGEFTSMHLKLVHRVGGAAFGLAAATIILLSMPIPTVFYDFAGILIIATLCIPKYPVAYGLRSMLVALAAGGVAQSVLMGEHRLFDVFVGDIVGVASAYLVSYLALSYDKMIGVTE